MRSADECSVTRSRENVRVVRVWWDVLFTPPSRLWWFTISTRNCKKKNNSEQNCNKEAKAFTIEMVAVRYR